MSATFGYCSLSLKAATGTRSRFTSTSIAWEPCLTLAIRGSLRTHRLDSQSTADSTEFRPALASARAAGQPLVGTAVRDRDADGDWALHIYRPNPPAE